MFVSSLFIYVFRYVCIDFSRYLCIDPLYLYIYLVVCM